MNPPIFPFATLHCLLTAMLVLTGISCSTPPPAKGGDSNNRDHYTIAGYEFSARKGEDTRQKVVARFGPPLAEEKAGAAAQYHILTYPVAGEPEKLLLLFHGEELLGVFREGSRDSLASTVQAHERNQNGRVVLFSSWFDGKTTSFVASQEQLKKSPKWSPKGGGVAPLSASQAEAIALQWCQRKAPDLSVEPKVRQTLESPSLPGVSFYVVELGAFNPQLLRQVVVLMDGTVVAGEPESDK